MEYAVRFPKLCQIETRRVVLLIGMMATTILLFQCFMLPYRNVLLFLVPTKNPVPDASGFSNNESSLKSASGSVNSKDSSVVLGMSRKPNSFSVVKENGQNNDSKESGKQPEIDLVLEKYGNSDDDFDLDEDGHPGNDFPFEKSVDQSNDVSLEKIRDPENDLLVEKAGESERGRSKENVKGQGNDIELDNLKEPDTVLALVKLTSSTNDIESPPIALSSVVSNINGTMLRNMVSNSSNPALNVTSSTSSTGRQANGTLYKAENLVPLSSISATLNDSPRAVSDTPVKKKKKWKLPPILIPEMNNLLIQSRVSSHSMKPRWSCVRDREILSAKTQIENAPVITSDHELYAPVFRNISMFKRSYELMERILKIYVYKEGEKPIFHQPILKGIYASEGWFMKLMEGNKRFVVRDPRKAHLFYIPLGTRMLQFKLYVVGSHDKRNLVDFVNNYAEKIATKYPFWNRTGGADHFLAACHDWAPYETRKHLVHTIRALCNSDIHEGFKIGKDVSLPETYVRSARNPLRDLGGRPASKRPILAFYAGNMHGKLREILLRYWENKDSDMKILGPMPGGVQSKITYIQYMKTSKYCICPKGYEVNSPRVVEAIFYECVPVIISDNYVPPFFEVLNWEAFTVFVAEKDIPNLKDILLSIPKKKYLSMQQSVKKVQQHFLWHTKPLKYDIFHMTLHSVWFNRVFQTKPR